MTRGAWVLLAVILLAGCATKCDAPKVVRVDVPVSTPCVVDVPPPPDLATATLTPEAGIWDQMRALRAERLQLRGYVKVLEAALQGCQ